MYSDDLYTVYARVIYLYTVFMPRYLFVHCVYAFVIYLYTVYAHVIYLYTVFMPVLFICTLCLCPLFICTLCLCPRYLFVHCVYARVIYFRLSPGSEQPSEQKLHNYFNLCKLHPEVGWFNCKLL